MQTAGESEFLCCHFMKRRKVFPLIGMRCEALIDKNAVSISPCHSLQGKRDEITEASLGEHILIWEHPVIRSELEFAALFHCRGQKSRTEPSCVCTGDSLLEEDPKMCAVSAPRTFNGTRDIPFAARSSNSGNIFAPAFIIKIERKETAGVSGKDRENSGHVPPVWVVSAQMAVDHSVRQGQELLIRAA